MSRTVVGEGSRDSRGTYDLLESVLRVWHHPGDLCSASNMPGVPFLLLAHVPESIRTMKHFKLQQPQHSHSPPSLAQSIRAQWWLRCTANSNLFMGTEDSRPFPTVHGTAVLCSCDCHVGAAALSYGVAGPREGREHVWKPSRRFSHVWSAITEPDS